MRGSAAFDSENLTIFEQLDDKSGLASTLHELGNIAMAQWQYEEARHYYEKALALFKQLREPSGLANTLNGLGMLAALQGRHAEAGG